jgi:Protein of unknown function (DUF1614)
MNLNKLAELNAPVASIGGAGTFDGIFLTGIVAVLIASHAVMKELQQISPQDAKRVQKELEVKRAAIDFAVDETKRSGFNPHITLKTFQHIRTELRHSAKWRMRPCRIPFWPGIEGSSRASSMARSIEAQAGRGQRRDRRLSAPVVVEVQMSPVVNSVAASLVPSDEEVMEPQLNKARASDERATYREVHIHQGCEA